MVEDVEEVGTELEVYLFGQLRILVKGHIPVIDSRTVEETPFRVPLGADRRRNEYGRIEIVVRRSTSECLHLPRIKFV